MEKKRGISVNSCGMDSKRIIIHALAHVGCCKKQNKTNQKTKKNTKTHRLGGLSTMGIISHGFGGWKSKIKAPADPVSGENHFLVHRLSSPLSSHGGRSKGTLWGLCKGTNPIARALPCDLLTSHRPPSATPSP